MRKIHVKVVINMVATFVLVVLSALIASSGGEIFPFKEFEDRPELCKDLTNRLIEDFGAAGVTREELLKFNSSEFSLGHLVNASFSSESTFKPKTEDFFINSTHLISKRGDPSEHRKFKFEIKDYYDEKAWNLTIEFDSSANTSSIVPKGSLVQLLPMDFYITQYVFTEMTEEGTTTFQSMFHLIEGTRCKTSFDKKTGSNGNEVCWKDPSICRGPNKIKECIENDDIDYLCYDKESQKGKKPVNEDTEVHWMEIAWRIFWHKPAVHYIHKDNTIESFKPRPIQWFCLKAEEEGLDFYCRAIPDKRPAYGTISLKTLSGYSG